MSLSSGLGSSGGVVIGLVIAKQLHAYNRLAERWGEEGGREGEGQNGLCRGVGVCACDCVYEQHIRDSSVIQQQWCVSVTHTETMLSASECITISLPLPPLYHSQHCCLL